MISAAAKRVVAQRGVEAMSRVVARTYAQRRLLSVLAVLEQREGKLNAGSLSAITAAKKVGGSVHAFVAGASVKAAAEEAAKVEGVEKVIAVENAAYEKVRQIALS